jgi:hypothetical protein
MDGQYIKYFYTSINWKFGNPRVVLYVPDVLVSGYLKYNSVTGKLEPNTDVDLFLVKGEGIAKILEGLKDNSAKVEFEDVKIDDNAIEDLVNAGDTLTDIRNKEAVAKDELADCMCFCITPD